VAQTGSHFGKGRLDPTRRQGIGKEQNQIILSQNIATRCGEDQMLEVVRRIGSGLKSVGLEKKRDRLALYLGPGHDPRRGHIPKDAPLRDDPLKARPNQTGRRPPLRQGSPDRRSC
jgi:hypothetical protein